MENAVIDGCKKSDRRSIKLFYESCAGWMLGVAMRYISDRNEALSVVHIAILTGLDAISRFNNSDGKPIEAWLKTILIRKLIDYKRKEKRSIQNEPCVAHHSIATNDGEQNVHINDLVEMINLLPERSKCVFNLFAIEGYSHKEIAEWMDISIGTSKWHLNNARMLLQKRLEKYRKESIN